MTGTPESQVLTDGLYVLFRDLLLRRAGLFYPEHKRDDLVHGLTLAMKEGGYRNLSELYAETIKEETVWEAVLVHLTIGETSFFRNRPQFEAMRKQIFPDLFERRADLRTLRIWSAGCATGEEPYSIAMLLRDMKSDIDEWNISILGTDINPQFLLRAREGLYGNWSFRELSDDLKARFFQEEKNRWRLSADVRKMVVFNRLNLAEPVFPSITNGTSALDMILCRNVTIYFDEVTTRQIVGRFFHALSPGGWLIVGHAEPQASMYHQFEVHNFPNTVIYRKRIDAPLFALGLSLLPTSDCGSKTTLEPARKKLPDDDSSKEIVLAPSRTSATSSPTSTPSAPTSVPSPASTPSAPTSVLSSHPSSRVPSGKESTPSQQTTRTASSGTTSATKPPLKEELCLSSSSVVSTDINTLWMDVRVRLSRGDKTGAEQVLNDLLRVAPNHVEARAILGRIYADRGEWACAHYHCKAALESDPLHIDSRYILAQIYEHEEQFDEALVEYRRVVFLDRHHVPGILGMGNVWRQMGRMDDARRSYRNALKQLARLSPSARVPSSDGATASELVAYVTRQLQKLE